MDSIPEEWIDSAENQGNTVDLENFNRGNDNKTSCQIKAEGLEGFETHRQIPEQIDINPAIDLVNTTPVARNLQHIKSQEGAFENGYDSD